MAEIDGGALSFKSVMDNEQMNAAIEETLRRVQGLSDGTVAGGEKMDTAFQKTAADINEAFQMIDQMTGEHQTALKSLEAEYNRLGAMAGDAFSQGKDDEYRALQQKQDAIKDEITVRKQLLKAIGEQADALAKEEQALIANANKAEQNANTQTSMRGRIRELKEEMMLLIDQGINEQSEAYKALEMELGRLTDIQGDVAQQARILANDESTFQGILSGIQGISGAFSAATGAVSMFAGENENMQKIMVKVQSLMAITIGLQQVAQTLNKDSAFRLKTLVQIQNLYSASIRNTGTAFIRFGMSANTARIAAQALMATLTLGLGVAITVAITAIQKYIDKQQEAKKAQDEFGKKIAENAAKPIATINELSIAWSKLSDNIKAKEKFIEDNKGKFDSLGVSVKNAAQAEQLLIDNKQAFIETQMLKAKAMAAFELGAEKYKVALEKMQTAESEPAKYVGTGQYRNQKYDTGSLIQRFGRSNADPDKLLKDGQIAVTKEWSDWNEKQKSYQTELDNAGKKFFEMAATFTSQEQELLAKIGQSANNITEGSIKSQEKVVNDLQDQFKNAATEIERIDISKEIRKQQALLDKMNLSLSKTKVAKKNDDPVLKEIETKKKAYQDYFKWLDAGMKQETQVEFASLIEKGKTYKEYLQERLKDENLTWEQIYKLRDELASESDKTITQSFKESLQVQLDDADTVLERLDIIKQKRKELENDDSGLTKEKLEIVDKEKLEVDKEFETESKALLEQYKTYTQSRLDIEKQYQEQIKVMRKAGASEENIEIVKQAQDDALAALDEEIAQKEATFNAFISRIGQMSLEQLVTSLNEAERALAASEVTNGNNSKEETATLRATVKRLRLEIEAAQAEKDLDDKDKSKQWDRTANAIKKAKGEIDNMIDSMDFLDDTTKDALKAASNIANGTIAMIDGIKALGIGAAQSMSAVEKASVILAIIGAAVQIVTAIFNMASKAEKAHQEALAEVQKNKLAMQREYNLALLEQNLLLKEADTIFGTDNYRKAANAVNVYKESLKQLDESMRSQYLTLDIFGRKYTHAISGLDAITIKTGHHKTGLFGWGKGEDEYTAITQVYEDIITAEGKLNVERAKGIISTQTMSDANKAALQNLIDLAEMAEKAFEEMTDYLTDVFGELGGSMSDALTDAFRNGTDAAKAFSDSVSQMLEKLAQDMIYSVTLAPIMEQAQQQMLEIMGNVNLTDEQKFNQYAALMGQVTEDAIAQKGIADDLYKRYQEIANQNGIDIWKSEKEKEKENITLTGSVKGVTEETASMLGGQMNAMRINQIEATEILRQQLMQLYTIAQNTSYNHYLQSIDGRLSRMENFDSIRSQGLV